VVGVRELVRAVGMIAGDSPDVLPRGSPQLGADGRTDTSAWWWRSLSATFSTSRTIDGLGKVSGPFSAPSALAFPEGAVSNDTGTGGRGLGRFIAFWLV
jgi:hypothetical protein